MIFIHIVLFARLLLHMLPLRFFVMSKSILTYFKPIGNCNGEQQVKLYDPTGPLTEELPSLVISAASKDISTIRIVSSVAHCKLKIAKSPGKLKSKITNISSCNKFRLYGSALTTYQVYATK